MIYLLIFVPIIILLVFIIKLHKSANYLVDIFKSSSVIVFGKKGKGKDLLFQKVIHKRKNEKYLSNIPYGYKYQNIDVKDLNVDPNTFQTMILGQVTKVPLSFEDKQDAYISDGGVFLPSQYHGILDKEFKSLPIFYALSRHLYDMNIHINTQNLTRVWDKLREQADSYIKALGTVKTPIGLFVRYRYYEKYESAKLSLLPMPKAFRNKDNVALMNQFYATNGLIKERWIYISKRSIKYNTRHFRSILIDESDDKRKKEDD